jgi:hypothetical protein
VAADLLPPGEVGNAEFLGEGLVTLHLLLWKMKLGFDEFIVIKNRCCLSDAPPPGVIVPEHCVLLLVLGNRSGGVNCITNLL